jgi:hypothetical protein
MCFQDSTEGYRQNPEIRVEASVWRQITTSKEHPDEELGFAFKQQMSSEDF